MFSCFAGAALAPTVVRLDAHRSGWWLALAPLAAFIAAALNVPALIAGGEMIGVCIVVYGGAYLRGDPGLGRFHLLLLTFTAAMIGSVLADDLMLLFVFWELTSLTSYFLVGYRHEDPEARSSALQALLVTATGGLAMLAGFLLLGAPRAPSESARSSSWVTRSPAGASPSRP